MRCVLRRWKQSGAVVSEGRETNYDTECGDNMRCLEVKNIVGGYEGLEAAG